MSTNTSYELLLVSVAGDWPTRVSALATTQYTLHPTPSAPPAGDRPTGGMADV